MWALLPLSTRITVVVVIGVVGATALSGAIALLTGTAAPAYQEVSLIATIICVVLIPLAERIWRPLWRRFPALGKVLFPDLNGTWMGHLQSSWKKNPTDDKLPPIPTVFYIKQGLFNFSIKMQTAESSSFSTHAIVEQDKGVRIFRVWYVYHNQPKAELIQRSQRHDGAAWLEVSMDVAPSTLNGNTLRKGTQAAISLWPKSQVTLRRRGCRR